MQGNMRAISSKYIASLVVNTVDVHVLRQCALLKDCFDIPPYSRRRHHEMLGSVAQWRPWASLSRVFAFAKQIRRFGTGLSDASSCV